MLLEPAQTTIPMQRILTCQAPFRAGSRLRDLEGAKPEKIARNETRGSILALKANKGNIIIKDLASSFSLYF